MHLCLAIHGRLDSLTGGFLYDRFMVAHLRRRRHRIDILSIPRRPYGRHLLDNFSLKVGRSFNQSDWDLVLQDALAHPSFFLMNRRLRERRAVPIIAIVHQVMSSQPRSLWTNRFFRGIEALYFSSVDGFIFNSDTTKGLVQQMVGSGKPCVVSRPGGDRLGRIQNADAVGARARRGKGLNLVFLGNVTPVKGLYPLIETLAQLPPDTWRLKVAGSLDMAPGHVRRVRRLISAKALTGQVELVGALNGTALKALLSGSDLLVMPFAHEGYGIACLEALAHGLPVLASTEGAAKEHVRHNHNGFLISPGDKSSCRGYIEKLNRDRGELLRLSMAALQTSVGAPGWRDAMESIHGFLEKIVALRTGAQVKATGPIGSIKEGCR